jgi:hypothetical protein
MATADSALLGAPRRELYLDRRVCAVTRDRIDIHPARSIIFLPLLTLLLGIGCFPLIFFWGDSFPLWALVAITLAAVIVVPVSGLGLVYSIAGAHIVVDRKKQSAVLQQGYLGMGVGTQELVPFWKIDYVALRELLPEAPAEEEFAQYEVLIVKLSGRELSAGTVTVLRSEAAEGRGRALDIANLLAEMAGSRVAVEGPRPSVAAPGA